MNKIKYDCNIAKNLKILENKKILIYGAGTNFNRFIENYPLLDLNIVGIADIKFDESTEYSGLKAIPPNDIINHDFDLVLITMAHYEPIIQMLKAQLNIKQDIFYFQNDLLQKAKFETDSDIIIKLLFEINKSLKELLPSKTCGYYSQFSPKHMLLKQAAEQTLEYININASQALILERNQVFKHCLDNFIDNERNENDLFLEFGVWKGGSINYSSSLLPKRKFYGFDSFEGLPTDWHGYAVKKGEFNLNNELPIVNSNVELISGWFEETLPKFLKEHRSNVAFLHIDSDVYSSAKTILNCLSSRIKPGTIIIFDEYFNYPNWQEHEYKAFQEFVKDNNIKYEYLAFSHNQVAVKITGYRGE